MRREGYIIEEIVDYSNMSDSFDYVMRKNRRKRSRTGRAIMRNKESIIADLTKEISDGIFDIPEYREYEICERGKTRTIQCVPLIKRIALNAIMRVVEHHLHKRFIVDSAASIKGRGGLYLMKRMMKDIAKNEQGTAYAYKCDIRKFYQSVNQNILMSVIRHYFKDERLIIILERCVKVLDAGISIGLRSSQALGNLMLNYFVDHCLKDELGVKYFRRYCDDMVCQAASKKELEPVIKAINLKLDIAGLKIKNNEQVFKVQDRGIDFLGYITYPTHTLIRKHIKQRFARKWKKVKSTKRKKELISSFYGITKHADAKHLFKKITGISMKNFKELGIRFTPKDGKKRFDGVIVPLGELQNCEIIVTDFETDIKTRQGEGRYIVQYELSGVKGKFITNSEEMKSILDQVKESGELPFRTVIRRENFGQNKTKYIFE